MFKTIIIICTIALSLNAQWISTNSPINIDCRDVVKYDSILFVGTYGKGVFRSSNNGDSWEQVNSGLPNSNVVLVASNDNFVFAIVYPCGIYKSNDFGENWTLCNSPYSNYATVYGFGVYNDFIFVGYGYENTAYKSTDNGDTWTLLTTLPYLERFTYNSNYLFTSMGIGVWRSSDDGNNWEPALNIGLSEYAAAYKITANEENIFMTTYHSAGWNQERVYRSTNNGDNWIEITANLPITSDKPDIDIYNGKVFVVCQSEGVYYSANLGENWDIFSQESSAPGIFRLNLIGNYIYGTSMGEGAYRTNPDSSIWTPINNGFPRSTITCFYNYHNELYSGSPLDGLFRTSNSGGNWNRLGFSSGVSSITAVDSSLFVGTSVNEIFRSDNNGANWIFINDDFINNIHGTINLKAYQNKVFAGVWYIGAPFPIGGIFSSTDNGYNWSNLGIFNKVSSIAFKDSFIFISDYWTGVFRTSDEGQSWTNVNNGLGTPYTITLGVSQDYLFACTLDSGVFVSSNNGDTWIKKSAGLEGVIIQAIATIGDLIFIGTTSGVFSSSDFGDTWLDISSGLGDLNVYSLGISNSHLFAGTTSQGVWRFETPLPVELTFFNSILLNDKVLLNWNTATELNNYGFEIQRKQVFSSQLTVSNKDWQSVGFVFGNGTSNSPKSYSFTDEDLTSGKYSYRLKQIDNDGTFEYSNVVEITIGLPNKFILEQNFPNPFNPSTKISWQSPVSGHQTLKVYDVLGNEVTTLIDGFREAGNYTIDFNANKLSSGVYFYQLKAVEYIQTKKMILLR